jgi:hypothetical protein
MNNLTRGSLARTFRDFVMKLQPVLELSDEIVAGLVKGQIIRRGGVLHTAATVASSGMRIVAWMRETGVSPSAPDSLAFGMGALAGPLGLGGTVPSILTLGATLGFGMASLERLDQVDSKLDCIDSKLNQVDSKLDRIDSKLNLIKLRLEEIGAKVNRIHWTIELGFANVLNCLEQMITAQEIEILANLRAAAKLAWEAQTLEPGCAQRMTRLENALTLATVATEQLLLRSEQEIENAIGWFKSTSYVRQRLAIPDQVISSLRRYRQACIASATRAAIIGETGSPGASVGGLQHDVGRLQRMLNRLGSIFLLGIEPGEGAKRKWNYDDLLNATWQSAVPASRIIRWAKRFDPEACDWSAILESFRSYSGTKLTNIKDAIVWPAEALRNLPPFADLLDGASEDCDRISGYVLEYSTADKSDLSMSEYRDVLALSDIVTDRSLTFLCLAN